MKKQLLITSVIVLTFMASGLTAMAQCSSNLSLNNGNFEQSGWGGWRRINGRERLETSSRNNKTSRTGLVNLFLGSDNQKNYYGAYIGASLTKGRTYILTMYIKTSPNFGPTNIGEVGVWLKNGKNLTTVDSTTFSTLEKYSAVTIKFVAPKTAVYLPYVRFNGQKATDWVRVDDVTIKGIINPRDCDDMVLNPA